MFNKIVQRQLRIYTIPCFIALALCILIIVASYIIFSQGFTIFLAILLAIFLAAYVIPKIKYINMFTKVKVLKTQDIKRCKVYVQSLIVEYGDQFNGSNAEETGHMRLPNTPSAPRGSYRRASRYNREQIISLYSVFTQLGEELDKELRILNPFNY